MISIDQGSALPVYRQLYFALRKLIQDGAIAPGQRMPAIRSLASQLGISRNTVDTAYRQLKVEGYVSSRRGSGFVVEDLDFSVLGDSPAQVAEPAGGQCGLPGYADQPDQPQPADAPIGLLQSDASTQDALGRNPLGDTYGCTYDFSYGNRSAGSFPLSVWRSIGAGVLSDQNNQDMSGVNAYTDPRGIPALREQIALWVQQTRGCRCTPEQVIVQPGTQPALRNLVLLFGSGRRSVAFEEPGYDGARLALESQGCNIIPVPVYDGYDAYLEVLRKSRAKLAFVTPSSQFPLGSIMPMSTRLQLLDWAVKRDAYIIEDDYCCEFRYDGMSSSPSLQSLDTHGRVIYMGTTSKILSPALRLSYLILPPQLVPEWDKVFPREFCNVSWFVQEVMARLMASDQWRPYVHRTVNAAQNRHDLLVDCLQSEFRDSLSVVGEESGLHLLISPNDGRSSQDLVEAAIARGVRVYDTSGYWVAEDHPMNDYVLVGFSFIEDDLIPAGAHALKEAWTR